MSNIPADLKYTASHEWLKDENGIITVGITDFAQSELGDVVYVDLPTVGRILSKGDSFASVESVKTVSDVYAPIAGEVVEVNSALGAQSELINSDPYGAGFLIKIRASGDNSVEGLISADDYKAIVG